MAYYDTEDMILTTLNLLFEEAVKGGDIFRQWLYPNLPKNYCYTPAAHEEARAAILRGLSPVQAAKEIIARHRAGA